MRVAILGGSFNPPHVCHVLAATWVLSARPVDQVWLMPVGEHAFGKDLEPFEDRYAMLELARRPIGEFCRIIDIEQRLGGENRTIDTLRILERDYPDHHFSLIIGTDIIHESHKWKAWDVLKREYGFHVIGREGYETDEYSYAITLPEISSTKLRRKLGAEPLESCLGEIDPNVLDYIADRGLYGVTEARAEAWQTTREQMEATSQGDR